jgi:hypothetical protein
MGGVCEVRNGRFGEKEQSDRIWRVGMMILVMWYDMRKCRVEDEDESA